MLEQMSSGIKNLLSCPVLFDIFIKGWNNGPEGCIIKSGGDVGLREGRNQCDVGQGFDPGTSWKAWDASMA